jgi:hypothetical protein
MGSFDRRKKIELSKNNESLKKETGIRQGR